MCVCDHLSPLLVPPSSYESKRRELEEQQLHLNIGLDTLVQTERDVEVLRNGLAVKEAELSAKNKEASEKLQKIVAEQAEAEQQKLVRVCVCRVCAHSGCASSLDSVSRPIHSVPSCRLVSTSLFVA